MFLVFLLLEKSFELTKSKKFNLFFVLYHIGVIVSSTLMLVRGILSILELKGTLELSNGLDAAISGMSGLGHIILSLALIIFMVILKNRIEATTKQ